MLDQIPRGYADGFRALDERYEALAHGLIGNHPKRATMLKVMEDLPFTTYETILRQAASRTARPSGSRELESFLDQDTTTAERSEAVPILKVLTLRLLLSMTGENEFPGTAFLAVTLLLTLTDPALPALSPEPERVVRPPGRTPIIGPRTARAPAVAPPSSHIAARAVPGMRVHGGTL